MKKLGFTLIELIFVIVIVGILVIGVMGGVNLGVSGNELP